MLKQPFIFLCIFSPVTVFAELPVTFTSPVQQNTLLELYTSEGCSSCPPADRWLSMLKDDKKLWNEIVPVAFHVDYWDYLGWKDEFSKAEYSQRQRNYARWNNIRTIYTPGFLSNGREWDGWRRGRTVSASGNLVGKLTVSVSKGVVAASFKPTKIITNPVVLNVAWLGFDLEREIQAGENEGKKLKHDFVSINTDSIKGNVESEAYTWEFKTNLAGLPANKGAAFWVTSGKNPTPIQATGGML
jgi:hypothetical protein